MRDRQGTIPLLLPSSWMRPSQHSPDICVDNARTWEERDTMGLVIQQFGFDKSVLWI